MNANSGAGKTGLHDAISAVQAHIDSETERMKTLLPKGILLLSVHLLIYPTQRLALFKPTGAKYGVEVGVGPYCSDKHEFAYEPTIEAAFWKAVDALRIANVRKAAKRLPAKLNVSKGEAEEFLAWKRKQNQEAAHV